MCRRRASRPQRGELAFGTVDSWLLWQLTEGALHATDVTNASRTMLFNVRKNEWDAELLKLLDIPIELMPKVLPSSAHYGETRPSLLGAPLSRSAASPATSRARCSARPASRKAWPRTPMARAASC